MGGVNNARVQCMWEARIDAGKCAVHMHDIRCMSRQNDGKRCPNSWETSRISTCRIGIYGARQVARISGQHLRIRSQHDLMSLTHLRTDQGIHVRGNAPMPGFDNMQDFHEKIKRYGKKGASESGDSTRKRRNTNTIDTSPNANSQILADAFINFPSISWAYTVARGAIKTTSSSNLRPAYENCTTPKKHA